MGDEDKSCPKKEDNKRVQKSKFQLEALEKFYNEHKYPGELMKLYFANNIGLSLRQVSGWFCHRRAKDKRGLNKETFGHLKHSDSDVACERSTGYIQESCSSTKHENSRQFDSREVESKKVCVMPSSREVSAFEKVEHHVHSRHYTSTDDVFPESSSDSGDHLNEFDERYVASSFLRCTFQNSDHNEMNLKDLTSRRMNEDRYLTSKDWNQASSICSVKRKLGSLYCENGPPISAEFDPLPPGAFDTPIMEEDCHVHDVLMEPHCRNGACKSPMVVSKGYRSEMYPQKSHYEEKGSRKTIQASLSEQESTNYPFEWRSSLGNRIYHNRRHISAMGVDEELDEADRDFDSRNHESHCNYSFKEKWKRPSTYSHPINDHRSQISSKQKHVGYQSLQFRTNKKHHS